MSASSNDTILDATGHTAPDARYTISEVSDMTGISAFTLRYYDKCGFFPHLARTKGNMRRFSERDLFDLAVVDALRRSGLSIDGIRYFVRLESNGETGRAERLSILRERETVLEYQRDEVLAGLKTLERAIACEMGASSEESLSDGSILPDLADTLPVESQNGTLERLSEPRL